MTLRLGKTPVRIHGLLPALWAFTWITGGGLRVLPSLLALALHEGGHWLALALSGVQPEQIEITPYGGVISLEQPEALPPLTAFGTAAAGPFASLLGCAAAWGLSYVRGASFSFCQAFFRANLLLLLLNLIPVLPLDGGQMMRTVLARFLPYGTATRALGALGYCLGLGLCGVSVGLAVQGSLTLSPAFAGLYLVYAAAKERKQGVARYVTALIARRQRLGEERALGVAWVAAGGKTLARRLLPHLRPGKYHMICVVREDGLGLLGQLDEQRFCEGLLRDGGCTLEDMLTAAQSKGGVKN